MGKRLSEKEIANYGAYIYEHLFFNNRPEEFISQKRLAVIFHLSERTLREVIFHLRFKLDKSTIIRVDGKGIALSSDALSIRKASAKLLRQALSMIKTSKQMAKVANNLDPYYGDRQIELIFNTDKLEAHLKGVLSDE